MYLSTILVAIKSTFFVSFILAFLVLFIFWWVKKYKIYGRS